MANEKATATVKKSVAPVKTATVKAVDLKTDLKEDIKKEAPVAETKVAAAKTTAKKAATTAKTAAKKTATTAKAAAKKTATTAKATAKKATDAAKATAAKKTVAKKTTTTAKAATATKKTATKCAITVEFADKKYTTEDLEKIANDVWVYDYDKKASELKSVEMYVKPSEGKVYYVFNGNITGDFTI